MSHPIEKTIMAYESMKKDFSEAIRDAGGNPHIVMSDYSWTAVMAALVANDIVIEARYVGNRAEPE